jgi:hypothetical protein
MAGAFRDGEREINTKSQPANLKGTDHLVVMYQGNRVRGGGPG